jgi:ATP-dependent DNA helicase DinG
VVVSTGTRTLQEQIARHDLPLLEQLLGRPVAAVTLKGVSNYVCQRRLHELGVRPGELFDADPALSRVLDWSRHSPTGDRAELPELADDHPVWARVTTTPDGRLAARCPFFDRCFVTRGRRAAEKAELILVNHHLFFADLALRTAGGRVLPDYDAVVFDEAHQLEEVMTEHFGTAVSTVRLAHLVRDLNSVHPRWPAAGAREAGAESKGLTGAVERAAERFFAGARRAIQAAAGPDSDRVELPAEALAAGALRDAWLALDTALDDAAAATERAANATEDDADAESGHALVRRIHHLRDDLALLAERAAPDHVYWGEARGAAVFLRASPVEVADILADRVLGDAPVVLTSATLTSAGSFAFVRERLGLTGELADELALESPFDYGRQAMLYVARDLPLPREDGFTAAACARIAELLAITGGRAFVLFTSHRALAEAAERLPQLGSWPLLVQGRDARAGLIDAFRATPGAVLLGAGSFWEGVDVPGDALSQVIIDKLPFASPGDPLVRARLRRLEERGDDAFARYQVPEAALALKQGFGRLIRRRDDRGIVSVLDGRLVGKLYGRAFLATLPGALPRTASIERVRRWWNEAS